MRVASVDLRRELIPAARDRLLKPLLGRAAAKHAIDSASRTDVAGARPFAYPALLHELASDCHSVLDVGTGTMRMLADLPCPIKLGLEPHRPYLEHRVETDAVGILGDARDLTRLFMPDSVALVTMLDVIEHLDQEDALDVLAQCEAIASRRVVAFTPRGWFPQDAIDLMDLGGEELQRHRSAWDVTDFTALGYRVVVLRGYHDHRNVAFVEAFGQGGTPVDGLVAWKDFV